MYESKISVGNLGMSMAALHCPIAPLCLIFCNDTYRKYTFTKLKHVFTMRKRKSAPNSIAHAQLPQLSDRCYAVQSSL
ncbi:unnamed protein product [Cylicocyclus nassatus]|uniref:Uncharacterized protein n=1 Tax=Cylicocyclus nassatus TaxID=53992 RepID=A0AA36HDH7_CYLNA|nr:unnamed protein product [Cylicocyclus nassatus]